MNTVIFDIDGVLANSEHRLHFILSNGRENFKPNWPMFDRMLPYDTVIEPSKVILKLLISRGVNIVVMTGRGERVRQPTCDWLTFHRIPFNTLLMRKDGDQRQAAQVKGEMLDQLDEDDILCIFEDEPKTVTMMRERGHLVYNPAEWKDGYEQATEGGAKAHETE